MGPLLFLHYRLLLSAGTVPISQSGITFTHTDRKNSLNAHSGQAVFFCLLITVHPSGFTVTKAYTQAAIPAAWRWYTSGSRSRRILSRLTYPGSLSLQYKFSFQPSAAVRADSHPEQSRLRLIAHFFSVKPQHLFRNGKADLLRLPRLQP